MNKSLILGSLVAIGAFGAGAALVNVGASSQSATQTVPASQPGGDESALLFCAAAPGTISISGSVRLPQHVDPIGRQTGGQAPAPGAAVVISRVGGATSQVYANGSGQFAISGLPPGAYRIQAFWNGRSSGNGNLNAVAGHSYTRVVTIN